MDMLKLNLKAYTGRDIQTVLGILNQCENKGVVDIRLVRQQLHDYVHNQLLAERIKAVKVKKRSKAQEIEFNKRNPVCPSCKKGRLFPAKNDENLNIVGCSLCRFSTIMDGA